MGGDLGDNHRWVKAMIMRSMPIAEGDAKEK